MDAIHYKIREDGRILNRAAYLVLGVTLDGTKDILSINIGANEFSKFWLGMLNDLKNRGVQEVLFFCVDGLAGFKEAIHAVYPQAEVQRCIIHICVILLNMYPIKILKNLQRISRQFIRLLQKNWPYPNWRVWKKSGARNILMQYQTGNKTGKWYVRFSDLTMISEGSCIPQILSKELTANSVKWQKPKVVFPVTILWRRCYIWQVRMLKRNGRSGTGIGIWYSAS